MVHNPALTLNIYVNCINNIKQIIYKNIQFYRKRYLGTLNIAKKKIDLLEFSKDLVHEVILSLYIFNIKNQKILCGFRFLFLSKNPVTDSGRSIFFSV